MRMSYSMAAHLFLFLVQWTDCNLAGALGLLRILIYKVYVDGTTTMSTHERKASIREFYAVIYPSLLQLQKGVTDTEDKKQKAVCLERYRKRDEDEHRQPSDIDIEREEECGICMEMNSKIVLPDCNHVMCLKCYHECMHVALKVLVNLKVRKPLLFGAEGSRIVVTTRNKEVASPMLSEVHFLEQLQEESCFYWTLSRAIAGR
ncbi:E3 ubiquitin-protein ligase AIRP2 isoform X2 [Vigna angularis]|nr:E3 ubiquitin-protein ligase AIRP2 isoform X2 [Vigna angularis]